MEGKTRDHAPSWLHRLGWVILLLAAGFWTLFTGIEFVSGLIGGETPALVGGLMEFTVFVAPLWIGVVLAWRWPPVGAVWLLLDGAILITLLAVRALTFYIPPADLVMTALTLGLPPLVAGLLFLVAWWRSPR